MSYTIETKEILSFVEDSNIKLPRFQRKSTWKPGQNFELAISVFKEYPLGVIVVNDEQGTLWLLDGRQRRTALKELCKNPDLVYDSAKKYIGFNAKESEDKLKELYWKKINTYLISDKDTNSEETEKKDDEYIETDIDQERQKEGLKVLLDIILMVHQKIKDKESGLIYGKWERLFKLDRYLKLDYAPKRDNYRINPEELHKFLLTIGKKASSEKKDLSSEYFIELVEESIKDGQEKEFRDYIEKNWLDMRQIIDIILHAETIFRRARIGVISIKNVTPLDAQNIFSVINTGGSPLSPEELISAKPFWNNVIEVCKKETTNLVKSLYERLDVTALSGGDVVRWDIAATLLGRIQDKQLFFKDYQSSLENGLDFKEIGLGFKLLSAWFVKGISKIHINKLENNKEILWPESIEDFIMDFNSMVSVLLKDDFFKKLNLWQKPMIDLLGESATFAFVVTILKNWKDLDEPLYASANLNKFYRNARGLFDNLMFGYATGYWRGSGDSKMAILIKQPEEKFKPLDNKIWESLILNLCIDGTFNGQKLVRKNLEPLLYYQIVIRNLNYPLQVKCEIDHIIPRAILKDNTAISDWFEDSIVNLSVLPKEYNNDKKDKKLSDLIDPLAHMVSEFTGIPKSEFNKYSKISGISDFIEIRKKLWIESFCQTRLDVLNF